MYDNNNPMNPIVPFEPVSSAQLTARSGWTAQIKWDGVRMLTYWDGAATRLVNRRLNDKTLQYPEFARASDYIAARSAILDGELIAMNRERPSFHEIMRRDRARKSDTISRGVAGVPVTYMVFDVLYCEGEWLTDKPLRERQAVLRSLLKAHPQVQLVADHDDPAALLAVMKSHRMEGIVTKDLDSRYLIGGKDGRWMKHKIARDLAAGVGGVTLQGGIVNALLLGLYDEAGRFCYIGHAGAGKLTHEDYRSLTERLPELRIACKPFVNKTEREREAVWIAPDRVAVKVNYLEWTTGGTLRHPVLQGFLDAGAADCSFAQPE